MNDKIKLLELANKQIASNEEFVAYFLAQYSEIENATTDTLMEALGCDIESFYKLGLCKAPTAADVNYLTELNKVSDYIGISVIALNKIIRRVDTVMQLRNSNPENAYLMAARDKNKKSNEQDNMK